MSEPVDGHDIIVVGASTGGVEALTTLASGLPPDLPASLFVVLHIPEGAISALPKILSRSGPLRAVHPTDDERIERGVIYVAPPDAHLLVKRGAIRLTHGPRENRVRPAIDPLFRTAAQAYGPRVVGVVLTGALNDGTAGLLAIKRRGGVAVVQDPDEAVAPGMPSSALRYVTVDARLPLRELAPLLTRLASEPVTHKEEAAVPEDIEIESRIAYSAPTGPEQNNRLGALSPYICPECKGPLWEIHDDALVRYRCWVGHGFTAETLDVAFQENVEDALWMALNVLEQSAQMSRHLAEQAREKGRAHIAERFDEKVDQTTRRADVIRQALAHRLARSADDVEQADAPAAN